MKNNFTKFSFLFMALIGVLFGVGLIFGSDVYLMRSCSKSCGTIRTLVEIFGDKVTRVIIGILWIGGGTLFAWIALKKESFKEG